MPMASCLPSTGNTCVPGTSSVARARITTARLWNPLLPPSRAMTGIRAARMGSSSMIPVWRSMTKVTSRASSRLRLSHGRRILTEPNTGVKTVSWAPAPVALAKSSEASIWIASMISSLGRRPSSRP